MSHSSIALQEIYAAVESELDDVYTDGFISAAIYNKKTVKRFLLYAINQADRHICLQLKLKKDVFIYVPAGQKTIFFSRQGEYIGQMIDQYSDLLSNDGSQYAYLISDESYMDVISAGNSVAIAFGKIPIDESDSGIGLWNSEAADVFSNISDYQYQTSNGSLYTVRSTSHRYFVDGNAGKLVLDQSFNEDKWILLNAQIAPIRLNITGIDKGDLNDYKIRSPYYAQQWLINRAMTYILPNKAASESGYYDLDQRFKLETLQNQPDEGNIILPGDEMGGNYEAQFDDF